MWKSLLAGTALLALAGSGLVLAQQNSPEPRSPGASMPSTGASSSDRAATDRQAYLEARIAALRAGLQLGPEQEKAWPAFERAYRAFVAMRAEMRDAMRNRRDMGEGDPMERLERFADRASRRATALKDLADATGPLVRSLDDSQKRRFWALARPLGPRFADAGQDRGPGGWHHDGHHHGHGHGDRDGGYGRYGHHHYGYGQGWSDRFDRHGDDGYRRDGDRRDGYGRGYGRGPDGGRSDDGPPWREGRRFDDDRRGGHGSGPPPRRDDDRRRPSTGEERL
ncbi:hypothetical protein RHODGE_RHODGE_00605 [Rhodoplanes serenus]|uniref:LTXXQ motif family protein n=1 Tax=Rhodoplanes serenus TaxID=200615 RepID=A0A3S4F7G1_9BRAD|nr:Spy/CpxP family protein refolding chaperone [Rhodoplanes serenus]VCU07318.1 hypothetical protein RHODGE_RHODGE_00605 [Rhodoplanes serenus]